MSSPVDTVLRSMAADHQWLMALLLYGRDRGRYTQPSVCFAPGVPFDGATWLSAGCMFEKVCHLRKVCGRGAPAAERSWWSRCTHCSRSCRPKLARIAGLGWQSPRVAHPLRRRLSAHTDHRGGLTRHTSTPHGHRHCIPSNEVGCNCCRACVQVLLQKIQMMCYSR